MNRNLVDTYPNTIVYVSSKLTPETVQGSVKRKGGKIRKKKKTTEKIFSKNNEYKY